LYNRRLLYLRQPRGTKRVEQFFLKDFAVYIIEIGHGVPQGFGLIGTVYSHRKKQMKYSIRNQLIFFFPIFAK
jgi:hypothetical protein